MRPTIAKLRKTLPEFLSIIEYCNLKGCCRASAYNDLRRIAGLGVKLGPNTFIVRDVALDEMARAEEPIPWVPQEKRTRPRGTRRQRAMHEQHAEAQP
jgi:hypothetical protein